MNYRVDSQQQIELSLKIHRPGNFRTGQGGTCKGQKRGE
jgi:hypothetical protein